MSEIDRVQRLRQLEAEKKKLETEIEALEEQRNKEACYRVVGKCYKSVYNTRTSYCYARVTGCDSDGDTGGVSFGYDKDGDAEYYVDINCYLGDTDGWEEISHAEFMLHWRRFQLRMRKVSFEPKDPDLLRLVRTRVTRESSTSPKSRRKKVS